LKIFVLRMPTILFLPTFGVQRNKATVPADSRYDREPSGSP
jgi:hypothetical protein